MNSRVERFRQCDSRIFPYLDRVIERLPHSVKEDVLNNKGFQMLADESLFDTCSLHYEFDPPVQTLIYLNAKLLREPEHHIIYTIALEIANAVLRKNSGIADEKKSEAELIVWGFKEEVEAVRYDRTLAESEKYRVGYEWAKKQSKDYLLQHFGLYFDEWNEKGLARTSSRLPEGAQPDVDTGAMLDSMIQTQKIASAESEEDESSERPASRDAVIAGIMAAVKEIKLRELFDVKTCATRHQL
jgi:hypothetical protein